jgi:hypothetical protein
MIYMKEWNHLRACNFYTKQWQKLPEVYSLPIGLIMRWWYDLNIAQINNCTNHLSECSPFFATTAVLGMPIPVSSPPALPPLALAARAARPAVPGQTAYEHPPILKHSWEIWNRHPKSSKWEGIRLPLFGDVQANQQTIIDYQRV